MSSVSILSIVTRYIYIWEAFIIESALFEQVISWKICIGI